MKSIVFIDPNPAHAMEEALPAVLARAIINRLEQMQCAEDAQKMPGLCAAHTENHEYASLY